MTIQIPDDLARGLDGIADSCSIGQTRPRRSCDLSGVCPIPAALQRAIWKRRLRYPKIKSRPDDRNN